MAGGSGASRWIWCGGGIRERYGAVYAGASALYPESIEDAVVEKAGLFRRTFPSESRPSSRATFLFGRDGEPLRRSEFESVLQRTDKILGTTAGGGGPFFCGDVLWAPFLERYGVQLPCVGDNTKGPTPITARPAA